MSLHPFASTMAFWFGTAADQRATRSLISRMSTIQMASIAVLEILPAAPPLHVWEGFWSHVEVDDTEDDVDRWCWVWNGAKRVGYGAFKYGGKTHGTHRLLMEWVNGGPLGAQVVDHLCGNRACVRPSHLDVTDQSQNMLRGSEPHFHVVAQRGPNREVVA